VAKQDPETVSLRLDSEDAKTLADLVKVEKLSKSDVIRRAIRAYAERLGVVRKRK
jgi:predicted transcriptional regulator